jgi:hypothetical protein
MINNNTTHHLHHEAVFMGLPVMTDHLPMITVMLASLREVVHFALDDHSRVFAFRFDLHLPTWMDADAEGFTNTALSRFFDSLKAKIRHNRIQASAASGYAHKTRVRYFWTREAGSWERVHYHCVVLVNGDAFFRLGNYQSSRENMANRVFEAWASALNVAVAQARTLVHFPENPSFLLERNNRETVEPFFYRTSYLCKAATKHAGYGHHSFGSSRG